MGRLFVGSALTVSEKRSPPPQNNALQLTSGVGKIDAARS
jgi:hypothetical protein